MIEFISIKNKIIRKDLIRVIEFSREVEQSSYNYPGSMRTTTVYVYIMAEGFKDIFTFKEEKFNDLLKFIADLYNIDNLEVAKTKTDELINNARISNKMYK